MNLKWDISYLYFKKPICRQYGFSLVEMAVVLVIVGLMMSALAMPVVAQMDQKNYRETEDALAEWREGIIGYAASHGYLPCPDNDGDGREDRSGINCTNVNGEGDVPWSDLGLKRLDAWNNTYHYRVSNIFSNSGVGARFTLSSEGNIQVLATNGTLVANKVPAVILSKGKNGMGAGVNEMENSDADGNFVSDTPIATEGNEFDDVVVWIPTTLLFNRMITAGKLP